MPASADSAAKFAKAKNNDFNIGPSMLTPAALKSSLVAATNAERWWASVVGDMSYIDALRPSVGDAFQDDAAGRCILTYPGHSRRSVS